MKAIDFVRDGRVGDKVHDIMLGDGVIRKLNPLMRYSVECNIDGAHTSYTATGKVWHDDLRPRLCWGHRGDLDQGQPPKHSIWMPTKPTWCDVSGSSRVMLIYTGSARGLYEDSQGCRWTKAEPCATKDIPDWWPKEWI